MSVSHRRRLGIPDGHVQIYGEHVPFEHAEPIRYWAYWIAWKLGRPEAEAFVREQTRGGYPDIDYLTRQWAAKLGASEIREMVRAIRQVTAYAD